MTANEKIRAIRSVRIAAHDLANACAAITGGVEMALSLPTVSAVGESLNGLSPMPLSKLRRFKN